jgi:hypothetical protein
MNDKKLSIRLVVCEIIFFIVSLMMVGMKCINGQSFLSFEYMFMGSSNSLLQKNIEEMKVLFLQIDMCICTHPFTHVS